MKRAFRLVQGYFRHNDNNLIFDFEEGEGVRMEILMRRESRKGSNREEKAMDHA